MATCGKCKSVTDHFKQKAHQVAKWESIAPNYSNIPPPRDCMTLMLVVGLVWSNESQSYAGGSVATGRVSHARLVCDEDPD